MALSISQEQVTIAESYSSALDKRDWTHCVKLLILNDNGIVAVGCVITTIHGCL